jgi:DNA-binding NtrC family response regulator
MKVLVVDDQRSARLVIRKMLAVVPEVELVEAATVSEALALVSSSSPDLLLLDIRLSSDPRDRGGLDLLRKIRASGNAVPAVMVTSLTELSQVREAMRSGAQDYVLKDELSPEMLLPVIEGFRERLTLRGEVAMLRQRVQGSWGVSSILGSSREMENVRRLIMRVADANATVLIRGETGTGKELVARALHQASPRRDQPFVAVNCSALPGALMESLLFGHERGAFTGAERRARGQFELAGAGTVLLDEIAEMPAELQAKLLRVLEDRTFRPLGSETIVPLRARVLAATHVDLESRMTTGRFREDLFYRLNVVHIDLPSLAEREEDVPELVATFASQMQRKLRFTESAMTWLTHRPWHGNVRELRNLIERLVLLAEDDFIDVPALELLCGPVSASQAINEIDRLARSLLALPDRLGSKLAVMERAVLHHAIETCGGNKSAAARMIGVDRRALERKWERLGEPGDGDDSGSDPPDEK